MVKKKRYIIKLVILIIIIMCESCVLFELFYQYYQNMRIDNSKITFEVNETEIEVDGQFNSKDLIMKEDNYISEENIENKVVKRKYKKVLKEKFLTEYSITNSSSYGNRNENLVVASKIINGKTKGYILKSGEKFSWLSIVGNPEKEKGFKEAGIIKNHKHALGYGGGVCQVSSTIYSAAYYAGIIKKGHYYAQTHSVKSSYIDSDKGDKEATVSYSAKVDFWFENTLKNDIRIKVKAKDGTVKVKIYERKYKMVCQQEKQ